MSLNHSKQWKKEKKKNENSTQEAKSYQQVLLAVLVLQPSKTIQKPNFFIKRKPKAHFRAHQTHLGI